MNNTIPLESKHLDYLLELAATASSLNIDKFKIVDGKVGGINDDKTVFILNDLREDIPFSAGITRVPEFVKRVNYVLQAAKEGDVTGTYQLHAMQTTVPTIYKLNIRGGKRISVDYKFGSPQQFKVPMALSRDIDMSFSIPIDDVKLILNGINTMGPDVINVVRHEEGDNMFIEIPDALGDKVTIELDGTEGQDTINCKYDAKLFAQVMRLNRKHHLGVSIDIAVGACMRTIIDDIGVHLFERT